MNSIKFYIDPDITLAETIHKDFYLDNLVFEVSKEKIFNNIWTYVAHQVQFDDKNAIPVTLFQDFKDEPIVAVENVDGNINVMSNVCTHRANKVVNFPCQVSRLRCTYHGRTFDLNGKFQFMPEFKEVKNFPCENDHLHTLTSFDFHGLLFSFVGDHVDFDTFFQPMINRIAFLPLSNLKFQAEESQEFFINAHWGLYVENYLEGFHIPFVHQGLSESIDYSSYTTEIFENSNLQVGLGKHGEDCFEIPIGHQDHGKYIAAYYFWLFPNLMFNFYPWGLSLNIVEPINVERTRVTFHKFVFDESKLGKGAGRGLTQVEIEDEEIVENVQKGIKSSYYQKGRYAPNREQGTHHFHSLIANRLKDI